MDEQAQITLVERGPYISFANCGLPYHIGKVIPERESLLVQKAEGFSQRFGVTVLTRTEAVAIDPAKKTVTLRKVESGEETVEPYDELVLSPGAEPIRPPLPGVDLPGVHVLRNIPDLDRIVAQLEQGSVREAVVGGAGFIGLEVAENLAHRGVKVTVVELAAQVMPLFDAEMAAPLAHELALHGVEVRLGSGLQAVRKTNGRLTVDIATGEAVPADLVVLAIGVKPETTLAKQAGLKLGPQGGIQVDRQMRTSDPHIYAVGDAVEVFDRNSSQFARVPLAGPANRQGRLVADVIAGREARYPGTVGSSIVKVFDLVASSTGLSEKQAKKLGLEHDVVWVHGASHAGYYPGATPLTLKLLFAPKDGRVLGAQVVGREGVDKRIDVLATAVAAKMTVYDLEELDLAYAPPFSSAKDPVNHLAAVAANRLRGDHPTLRWDEMEKVAKEGSLLLDVRTKDEFECGTIPGAVNIPVDELRARLAELPKDQPIAVFCQVGLRGYLATRILSQHGFKAANLLGGYKLWSTVHSPVHAPQRVERITSDEETQTSCNRPMKAVSGFLKPLDVRGLQCPGPILKLKEEMERLGEGEVLQIQANDPGFVLDLPAWAKRTGNEVLTVKTEGKEISAQVRKGANVVAHPGRQPADGQTIVVFSGELDKAMAAMIIATGGATMGRKPTLFFTFWGLNLLRRPEPVPVKKNLMERMFGTMLPRGASKATLSKMHMGGMGTAMMRKVMKDKNVDSLPDMLARAQQLGVRLVACQMSMDVMGIKKEELIDGVEIGGVAAYLDAASEANVNLFI